MHRRDVFNKKVPGNYFRLGASVDHLVGVDKENVKINYCSTVPIAREVDHPQLQLLVDKIPTAKDEESNVPLAAEQERQPCNDDVVGDAISPKTRRRIFHRRSLNWVLYGHVSGLYSPLEPRHKRRDRLHKQIVPAPLFVDSPPILVVSKEDSKSPTTTKDDDLVANEKEESVQVHFFADDFCYSGDVSDADSVESDNSTNTDISAIFRSIENGDTGDDDLSDLMDSLLFDTTITRADPISQYDFLSSDCTASSSSTEDLGHYRNAHKNEEMMENDDATSEDDQNGITSMVM